MPARAAVQLGGRGWNVQPRDVLACDRARALERRLRRALASPDGRTLRREPESPSAVPPVPGDPQAIAARDPGALPRLASRPRDRPEQTRHPLHRGRLGVSDAGRVGPGMAGVDRRTRDLSVHLLPAGRGHRLQADLRGAHVRSRADRDVPPGRR